MKRIKTIWDCHNYGYQLLDQSPSLQLPENIEISITLWTDEFEQFKKDIHVDLPSCDKFRYFGVPGVVFEIKKVNEKN